MMNGSGAQMFSRFYDFSGASPPAATPQPLPFLVQAGPPPTAVSYGVFFTDQNVNPLSASTTFDAQASSPPPRRGR